MKTVENILQKIDSANERLCKAENNLQYIKALQSCRFWLMRFSDAARVSCAVASSAEYQALFYTGAGFSFADRVINSLQAYSYGERPF